MCSLPVVYPLFSVVSHRPRSRSPGVPRPASATKCGSVSFASASSLEGHRRLTLDHLDPDRTCLATRLSPPPLQDQVPQRVHVCITHGIEGHADFRRARFILEHIPVVPLPLLELHAVAGIIQRQALVRVVMFKNKHVLADQKMSDRFGLGVGFGCLHGLTPLSLRFVRDSLEQRRCLYAKHSSPRAVLAIQKPHGPGASAPDGPRRMARTDQADQERVEAHRPQWARLGLSRSEYRTIEALGSSPGSYSAGSTGRYCRGIAGTC